jgi:hypothetical protein
MTVDGNMVELSQSSQTSVSRRAILPRDSSQGGILDQPCRFDDQMEKKRTKIKQEQ